MGFDNADNYLEVILAEDDEEDILIFRDAVTEALIPVNLETVKNGELLMQLLLKFIPDLLFLDIHMPCKDGKQCIREIRANPRYDSLPVIVYSGRSDPDIISFFYRAGANQYIIKPETMDGLKRMLVQIFSYTIEMKNGPDGEGRR